MKSTCPWETKVMRWPIIGDGGGLGREPGGKALGVIIGDGVGDTGMTGPPIARVAAGCGVMVLCTRDML